MADDDLEEGGPSNQSPPISARVLDLFRQAKEAKSPKGRARVMLALAIAFTEDHDFTDFSATDDWHAYIEDFEQMQLQYERAGLRLARLVCNTMEEFYEEEDAPQPPADLGMITRTSKLTH